MLTNNKSCRYSETLGQGHRPQANESIMDRIVNVCLPTDHQRPLRTTYCSSEADWCKLPWTRQKREIVKTLGSRKPSVLRSSCVLCGKICVISVPRVPKKFFGKDMIRLRKQQYYMKHKSKDKKLGQLEFPLKPDVTPDTSERLSSPSRSMTLEK